MITAAVAVTLIYILANIAYMFLMTPGEIGSTPTLAADAVQKVLCTIGGGLIAIAIFISTFGTTGIYTLTAPRIYYTMAVRFVVNTLIEKPQQAWVGLLFLGIGIPVYYFWKRRK